MKTPLTLFSLAVLTASTAQSQSPRVGPPHGTVIVVGGGAMGPELYARFIQAAGGPDALIIDVPTAGGDSAYPADWRGRNGLMRAGAKHVVVLHTIHKDVANSDSFVAVLKTAGGVWFEGGRQWHLVDSYAGTKTEQGFHDVLARGGVVGGSSAGASILSSYLLRGARSGNTVIMAPGYEVGFGFLRGVAIDQHVVARERLRDLADSLMPKHPELLGISEDEGTAWVVKGDTADIIGRNKAFVYGGKETDPAKPFLTLFPGDRYDLAARRVIRRSYAGSPITEAFVDSLVGSFSGKLTLHVAQDGKVLLAKGYGIPANAKYMPATTVPNFPLVGLSGAFNALATQLRGKDTLSYAAFVTRRVYAPIGLHKTALDTTGGRREFSSNVDELYRLELGLQAVRSFGSGPPEIDSTDASDAAARVDPAKGWRAGRWNGLAYLALYGPCGRRNAFVRIPERKASVIVLSDQDGFDALGLADGILWRLLGFTGPNVYSGERPACGGALIGINLQGMAPTNDLPNPYRTVEGWAKLPAGRTWGSTSAVEIAKDGSSIWVAERCGANSCAGSKLDPILLFDSTGTMVKSFGAGMFLTPHGIFVDKDGNLWVTDCACTGSAEQRAAKGPNGEPLGHQVYEFSPDGKLLMTLGKAGGGKDSSYFWQPNDVLVAPNGDIFVTEGHSSAEGANARILKFNKKGQLLKVIGEKGSGKGQLDQPHALAMDSRGRLFVGDRSNNRIVIMDQDGNWLDTWSQFSRPSGIYIDKDDVIYVTDSESGGVSPPHGNWKRGIRIGSAKTGVVSVLIPDPNENATNTSAGEGVAVDAKGNIYGAEVGPKRLQRYVKP